MAIGLLGACVALLIAGASVSAASVTPTNGHYGGHIEGHPSHHVTFTYKDETIHNLHIKGHDLDSLHVVTDDPRPFFHAHLADGELGGHWASATAVTGFLEEGGGQFNWHAHHKGEHTG
jgi:hypothetical protein